MAKRPESRTRTIELVQEDDDGCTYFGVSFPATVFTTYARNGHVRKRTGGSHLVTFGTWG